MSDIPAKIKKIVHEELRGIYTISFCVVENFDPQQMEVRVSLKRDKNAIMEVPVASGFAQSDGYGEVHPLEAGDEGLLLHTKAPIEDLTVEGGHQDEHLGHVAFDINDALFFPRYWNDNDDKPADVYGAYKQGDYLLAHGSDTVIHIKGGKHADPGTAIIETGSGQRIVLDEGAGQINIDGVDIALGDRGAAKSVLNVDARFEYEDTQPSGATQTKQTSTVSNGESTDDTKLS